MFKSFENQWQIVSRQNKNETSCDSDVSEWTAGQCKCSELILKSSSEMWLLKWVANMQQT